MADPHATPPKDNADRAPATPRKPDAGDAQNAQRDEAKDEGAGKQSVPVEDLTTANDEGQG